MLIIQKKDKKRNDKNSELIRKKSEIEDERNKNRMEQIKNKLQDDVYKTKYATNGNGLNISITK